MHFTLWYACNAWKAFTSCLQADCKQTMLQSHHHCLSLGNSLLPACFLSIWLNSVALYKWTIVWISVSLQSILSFIIKWFIQSTLTAVAYLCNKEVPKGTTNYNLCYLLTLSDFLNLWYFVKNNFNVGSHAFQLQMFTMLILPIKFFLLISCTNFIILPFYRVYCKYV